MGGEGGESCPPVLFSQLFMHLRLSEKNLEIVL